AMEAQRGDVTDGGCDRRTQLFLIRRQLQPRMYCRDPRIDKSGPILRRQSHLPHMLGKPGTVLGIDRGGRNYRERGEPGDGEPSHANLLCKAAWSMGTASDTINLQF